MILRLVRLAKNEDKLLICLSVYLSIYLSIYLSVCLSVCLSVSKSLPSSAENTINRPRETQSGPAHANTLHIDRGVHHQPPPYSSTSLTTAPYHGMTTGNYPL